MLFTYKLLAFSVFCFQLILQLLNFSLERFLTNNNFHIFEGSTRYWQVGGELIHQWFQEDALFYLLQLSSIHLIGYIIFLLLAKPIPFQFISTFVSLIPLSCKMVFAFKGQVSKINASAFKGHLLDLFVLNVLSISYQQHLHVLSCDHTFCVHEASFLVFGDFDLTMHGWQYNYILLTTFIFLNLRNKHDIHFCVISMHDRSFLPISN